MAARELAQPIRLTSPERGLDGRGVLSKPRAPLMSDGRIGDFWIDTVARKLYGPKNAGAWPDNGLIRGPNGWTALTRVVADGVRRVREVYDWTGGEGDKPSIGYEGQTGIVPDIGDAVDYRGAQGPQALIDGLDEAEQEISDDTLISSAEAGGENEKRIAAEVFDLGGLLERRSIAHAASSRIRPSIKRIRTQFFAPSYAQPATLVGGAHYKRVDAEPIHELKFRSLDRFVAEGVHDSANGGWWEIDEATIYVEMAGARGDWDGQTGANDGPAINKALRYVESLGGGEVRTRACAYFTAETILEPSRTELIAPSAGSSVGSHAASIVGALALSPVVQTDGGAANRSAALDKIAITRENGLIPAGCVGLRVTGVDTPYIGSVFLRRHARGLEQDMTGVAAVYDRCIFAQCTEYPVVLKNGPEPTFIACRWGKNGGQDMAIQSYVLVDNSGGGNIDTLNFIRCQFNLTAGGAGALIEFKGYKSPNGIINFAACHAEHFAEGAVVVRADAATTIIRDLKFDELCTINSSGSKSFFDVPDGCALSRFSFEGETTFNMNLPSASSGIYKIGGFIEGGLSCGGARRLVLDGGHISGVVTLSGTITVLAIGAMALEGGLSDTSVGSKSIMAVRAPASAPIPIVGRNLYLGGTSRATSLGVRSLSHYLQLAGASGEEASALIARYANAAGPGQLEFAKSRGATVGAAGIVQAGDVAGQVVFSGDGGTAFRTGAIIRAEFEGTMNAAYTPAKVVIATAAPGSATPTDRLTIRSNGRYQSPLTSFPDYADDAAAATGGLAVGDWYRTGSALKIRAA